jgi:hypothetical protein
MRALLENVWKGRRMKPNAYLLLIRCIEDGIRLGYNRAHKHTDTPSEQTLKNEIENAITNEICEWFTFDENSLGS